MSEHARWVYYFGDPPHGSPDEMRAQLGGNLRLCGTVYLLTVSFDASGSTVNK